MDYKTTPKSTPRGAKSKFSLINRKKSKSGSLNRDNNSNVTFTYHKNISKITSEVENAPKKIETILENIKENEEESLDESDFKSIR